MHILYCTIVEIILKVSESINVSWCASFIIDVAMDGRWIGLHSILYSFVHISKSHLKCIADSVDGRKILWLYGKIWSWNWGGGHRGSLYNRLRLSLTNSECCIVLYFTPRCKNVLICIFVHLYYVSQLWVKVCKRGDVCLWSGYTPLILNIPRTGIRAARTDRSLTPAPLS